MISVSNLLHGLNIQALNNKCGHTMRFFIRFPIQFFKSDLLSTDIILCDHLSRKSNAKSESRLKIWCASEFQSTLRWESWLHTYKKYWIILINQKSIVKIASRDNLNNRLTWGDWKCDENCIVWPHFNTILSTHHVSAKHM